MREIDWKVTYYNDNEFHVRNKRTGELKIVQRKMPRSVCQRNGATTVTYQI